MITSTRTIYNGPRRTAEHVTAAALEVGDFALVADLYGIVARTEPQPGDRVRVYVEDEITGRFAGESTLPADTPAIARRLA